MAQEEWQAESVTALFKTKSNFRRERRLCNAVYNGRSAYMKFKKLNATNVKTGGTRFRRANNSTGLKRHANSTLKQMAFQFGNVFISSDICKRNDPPNEHNSQIT